uniref:Protein Flattop n=1 Tax=Anas zonorhyncha TaxID=75864 RepID=A0A8B9UTP0_9AVES
MARHGTVWYCMAQYGMAQHGTALNGMAWHGMTWHQMARHGTAWYMAWHGVARRGRASPWGSFLGTWDMPSRIPPAKLNLTARSAPAAARLTACLRASTALTGACNGLRAEVTGKVGAPRCGGAWSPGDTHRDPSFWGAGRRFSSPGADFGGVLRSLGGEGGGSGDGDVGGGPLCSHGVLPTWCHHLPSLLVGSPRVPPKPGWWRCQQEELPAWRKPQSSGAELLPQPPLFPAAAAPQNPPLLPSAPLSPLRHPKSL